MFAKKANHTSIQKKAFGTVTTRFRAATGKNPGHDANAKNPSNNPNGFGPSAMVKIIPTTGNRTRKK